VFNVKKALTNYYLNPGNYNFTGCIHRSSIR
jgi:hypothetical protein